MIKNQHLFALIPSDWRQLLGKSVFTTQGVRFINELTTISLVLPRNSEGPQLELFQVVQLQ